MKLFLDTAKVEDIKKANDIVEIRTSPFILQNMVRIIRLMSLLRPSERIQSECRIK